jgi:uncharacterized protein
MDESPHLRSRRSLNLRFDIPTSKTREFWDSLKKGKLITTKCTRCGEVTFPPQADCPKCMSDEHQWVELSTEATLVTFTRVEVAPASFAGEDPYTIAIAELDGGLKVLAWLEGVRVEDAKPGMGLRIMAKTSEEGSPFYVFVPA